MVRRALCLAALVAAIAPAARAASCAEDQYQGNRYTVCRVDTGTEDLRLFLRDETGEVYGQFGQIDAALAEKGRSLSFAMNAGMYHDDRAPVGHYVEDGAEAMRLITNPGPGNFGLLPNGVFCIRPGRADVIETLAYEKDRPDCRDATQSGPMLVIDGALHPRFLPDSTSRYIRNGVGTSADGSEAIFVISDNAVTFWEFGSYFKDVLGTPNALYFDGNVSRLYSRDLDRSDAGRMMGPIVGVVAGQ